MTSSHLIREWRAQCVAELRARPLVYIGAPITDLCARCGHGFAAPGEARRVDGALVHVACSDTEEYAPRGGA